MPLTITPPTIQEVGCRPKPTWINRIGIQLIEDVGNGIGIAIGWEEARPADFNQTIHYNIYFSDTRFGVFIKPKAVTTARTVTVNIPPGNINYFAVRATEFDTDIDINEMTQISSNAFQYPPDTILLNNLDDIQDAYVIEVDDVTGYPSVGELLINTEIIRYSAVDTVNNEFIVDINNRAISLTNIDKHFPGDTVIFWTGIEDGNTIIRQGLAAWNQVTPQNVEEIGEFNVDADGYRAANQDDLTTDLSSDDAENINFPNFDYTGYHKQSLQSLFSGDCINSYVGGEFNGGRGLFFQERNLARLDAMLQVTGETVILLRRKWTGKRCKCIGLRREHARTRCGRCYGTSFAGGYDRYLNPRAVSESFVNTRGFIMARVYPYIDDLKIDSGQGLTQTSEPTSWTLSVPTIKDRDILIRFNQDGTEEFRYECLNVTRNSLFFGETGKQEFRMLRMDKTDIIYQFDISTP